MSLHVFLSRGKSVLLRSHSPAETTSLSSFFTSSTNSSRSATNSSSCSACWTRSSKDSCVIHAYRSKRCSTWISKVFHHDGSIDLEHWSRTRWLGKPSPTFLLQLGKSSIQLLY